MNNFNDIKDFINYLWNNDQKFVAFGFFWTLFFTIYELICMILIGLVHVPFFIIQVVCFAYFVYRANSLYNNEYNEYNEYKESQKNNKKRKKK